MIVQVRLYVQYVQILTKNRPVWVAWEVYCPTSTYSYMSCTDIRANMYKYVLYASWCTECLVGIIWAHAYSTEYVLNSTYLNVFCTYICTWICADTFIQELMIFVSADDLVREQWNRCNQSRRLDWNLDGGFYPRDTEMSKPKREVSQHCSSWALQKEEKAWPTAGHQFMAEQDFCTGKIVVLREGRRLSYFISNGVRILYL